MKRWLLLLALGWFFVPLYGRAQTSPPVASFNPSQLQIPATGADFNTLINRINAILVPALGSGSGLVNLIGLSGGTAGNNAQIGLQPGADANAGIQINPNGSGNIILFGSSDTGVLQFGSSSSLVPATGFAACPGVIPNKAPIGVQGVVKGYIIVKDWLGNSHGWATC